MAAICKRREMRENVFAKCEAVGANLVIRDWYGRVRLQFSF